MCVDQHYSIKWIVRRKVIKWTPWWTDWRLLDKFLRSHIKYFYILSLLTWTSFPFAKWVAIICSWITGKAFVRNHLFSLCISSSINALQSKCYIIFSQHRTLFLFYRICKLNMISRPTISNFISMKKIKMLLENQIGNAFFSFFWKQKWEFSSLGLLWLLDEKRKMLIEFFLLDLELRFCAKWFLVFKRLQKI